MHSANTRACLLMALSMAGFTINDIFVKSLTDTLPAGQIMALRGAMMAVLLLGWMRFKRRPAATRGPSPWTNTTVWLRAATEAAATGFFLYALARVPIANVSAVLQALPLTVTLGAALFFGERLRWRRITAIVLGFVGVMLVIQPGQAGFHPALLAVIACVFLATARDLMTRTIPDGISAMAVSLTTTIAVMTLGFGFMVSGDTPWVAMTATDWATLLCAALFLFVGYQGIVLAMRLGETGAVAPFRYTSLLWALVLGWIIFDELPNALALTGAAIIVASGLYTILRERSLERAGDNAVQSAASPPPARGT